MKKNIILLVIAAITISLIGLIGIQLYWIRNAVAVKEAHFERGVSGAVTEAIHKYNKIVLAQKLLFQDKQNQQLNMFFQSLDSISQGLMEDFDYENIDSLINIKDSTFISYGNNYYFEYRQQKQDDANVFDTTFLRHTNSLLQGGGYLRYPDNRNIVAQSFIDRSRFINDLLEDLFSDDIYFRLSAELNKSIIDSLINLELSNQGIFASFEFGIYNPQNNSLEIEKTGRYTTELLEKGYVFSLFPTTIFHNPEYLLLYFPGQKNYLLAQMNVMLLISTVLIIVIISSFAFTIFTVIRQKRLSIMKNDFINNMTHELKTPISTISLACQALSDQDVQKSELLYQNYITIIDEENQRLEMMTEKVLQTALLEKGKLKLNLVTVDIHNILNEAISKIGLQVERSNGRIIKEFAAKNPYVTVDKFHITNVFFNLLDNANKYTELSAEIIVGTENNGDGVYVKVKDNGIGISRINQQKVFNNLYRISTGNVHDVKGFGLGLAYVKSIIELHGGNVFLESELKKGSTFTIFVPFGK